MKKFIAFIFCGITFACIANAESININWIVGDETYQQTTCNIGDNLILPTAPTKYGYTFQGWGGYRRVEYLESTGTQYIDTGIIVGTGNFYASFDAMWIDGTGYGFVHVGSGTGSAGQGVTFGVLSNNNGYKWSVPLPGSSFGHFGVAVHDKVHFNWNIAGNTSTVTGYESDTKTSANHFGSNVSWRSFPVRLFSSGASTGLKVRIYNMTIKLDDVLVRDFVPVIDRNGTPCMYDRISHTCFYNAGTGQFTTGTTIITE